MQQPKILFIIITFLGILSSCSEGFRSSSALVPAEESDIATASPEKDTVRQIIKTAELKLQVKNVPEKVKEIQNLLNTMHGHIMHYEIHTHKVFQNQLDYSLDSAYVVNQISPEGIIKLKVPVLSADNFIQGMLNLDAEIDQLLIDEEDITESVNKKSESIHSIATHHKSSATLKQQMHDEEHVQNKISEKAALANLKYRTQYLWFDIYLQGNSYIEKDQVASTKNIYEPFYIQGLKALQKGWYSFSWLIIALMNIWPFLIIGIFVLFVFKKKKLKFNHVTLK